MDPQSSTYLKNLEDSYIMSFTPCEMVSIITQCFLVLQKKKE